MFLQAQTTDQPDLHSKCCLLSLHLSLNSSFLPNTLKFCESSMLSITEIILLKQFQKQRKNRDTLFQVYLLNCHNEKHIELNPSSFVLVSNHRVCKSGERCFLKQGDHGYSRTASHLSNIQQLTLEDDDLLVYIAFHAVQGRGKDTVKCSNSTTAPCLRFSSAPSNACHFQCNFLHCLQLSIHIMYYVTHTAKFTYPNARQPCVFSTFSMQHKLHTFYFGLFISVLVHCHVCTVRKSHMDRSLPYKLQNFPISHSVYS